MSAISAILLLAGIPIVGGLTVFPVRWVWNWLRPRTKFVVLDKPLLSEDELAGAFGVADSSNWFRALMQIAAEMERDANTGAQTTIANPGISAGCVGGAEHIGRLRDRILELQQKGFGRLDSERKTA